MQFPRFNLRNVLYCATLLAIVGLGGCGNSCFAGFSNNGNGGVSITAGNSPSACSSVPLVFKGTMRALVLKSPVCETCTAAARLEHVFVTVKSIQLRPSTVVDSDSLDWLEIAPALTTKPRQIDLMGNAGPEILVQTATLPAGSYRGLRLQFFSGAPASTEDLPSENGCGETGWNCLVKADGHVEPLRLTGDIPELLITFQSDSLVVVPHDRIDLRLSLEPNQVSYSSSFEGRKLQYVLVGGVSVARQGTLE
jgi:Domain of unknown function (DUF4382)